MHGIPVTTDIERRSATMGQTADAMEIVCAADLDDAAGLLVSIKQIRENINEVFDGPIKQAHTAHKGMLAAKKKVDGPLASADATIRGKVIAYNAEQERARLAEERRLQEEARQEAEELRLAEAERLEKEGRKHEAEAALDAPLVPAPIPTVPRQAPPNSMTTPTRWKYTITDESLIPRAYLMVNTTALGQAARSMKGMANIPGVRVYAEEGVAVSSR